jgi:hypothetical protein
MKKQQKPTPANAYTLKPRSGGFDIIYNGNTKHPLDWFATRAEAEAVISDLNAAMDGNLAAAGFDGTPERRKKVTA